jgi:hypothetical protein
MRGKITKTRVDALRPGDVLADSEVKGFVVRRLPSGAISYGLRYRVAGRQRSLALGLHGRITPHGARKLAKKKAGEVADDRDPARERQAEQAQAKAASPLCPPRLTHLDCRACLLRRIVTSCSPTKPLRRSAQASQRAATHG